MQERPLEEGADEFFEDTLREHAALVNETRKQFELLKPEMFRKIKKPARRRGLRPRRGHRVRGRAARPGTRYTDKIYWRRNKIERDVAVAFLLDMSRIDGRGD